MFIYVLLFLPATATIKILDVNDNAPEIAKDDDKVLNISEAIIVGTEVFTYSASDRDKDQTVHFSLLNSKYFNISSSGELIIIVLILVCYIQKRLSTFFLPMTFFV